MFSAVLKFCFVLVFAVLVCFVLRRDVRWAEVRWQDLTTQWALNSTYSSSWPQTPADPPASASWNTGIIGMYLQALLVYAGIFSMYLFYFFLIIFFSFSFCLCWFFFFFFLLIPFLLLLSNTINFLLLLNKIPYFICLTSSSSTA